MRGSKNSDDETDRYVVLCTVASEDGGGGRDGGDVSDGGGQSMTPYVSENARLTFFIRS
jgi:hypothetical protein